MREIKFRGKIISDNKQYNGSWMTGYLTTITFVDGVKYFIEDFSDWGLNTKFEVDSKTVGQYTGLKDKNGVEIYEGDILLNTTIKPQKILVKWKENIIGSFNGGFKLEKLPSEKSIMWRYDNDKLEVIGDIYENPELLTPNTVKDL